MVSIFHSKKTGGFLIDSPGFLFYKIIIMKLGFHISISGGFAKAAERANSLNCETIQLFSHNPRAWILKKIEDKEVKLFKEAVSVFGISPVAVHMPYLPNLASFDKDLYQKSRLSFVKTSIEHICLEQTSLCCIQAVSVKTAGIKEYQE